MNKLFNYLIIVLIAFTSLACAFATCDADNITADDHPIMIDGQQNLIDELSNDDLNQTADNNVTEDLNNNTDLDNNTIAGDDNSDNISNNAPEIKKPVEFSTFLIQNGDVLKYVLNYDLNCTGYFSLTITSGNETCMNCDFIVLGSNSFSVNSLSTHRIHVLDNESKTFNICLSYDGNADYSPTKLSQIIVVDSSIINKFVVSMGNLITASIMC